MRKLFLALGVVLFATGCVPKYLDPNVPRATQGDPAAAVVVEEFGDFQCPACQQAYYMVKQLKEQFGDQVLWKYAHFPLMQIHPFAFNAAMASECANDQGKFWEYHDMLFESQPALSRSDLKQYAEDVGLDAELFNACFQSRAKSDLVRSDTARGESLGVNSTPTFFINGEQVANYTTLGARIQALLTSAVPVAEDE